MANRVSIQLDKVQKDQLSRAINDAIKKAPQEVWDELVVTGLEIENDAKRLTPVQTGRLRSSIQNDRDKRNLSVEIGSNVEYAPAVEFGTVKQRAQPYLQPAYERNIRKLIGRLQKMTK
jgi:HK97 gp10 family phage protein